MEKQERKQALIQRNLANNTIADLHHTRILKHKVIYALKNQVLARKERHDHILDTMRLRQMKPMFTLWLTKVRQVNEKRLRLADAFRYRSILKR